MSILRGLDAFFFGHVDYAVDSRYSLEEAVRRVGAIVRPLSWSLVPATGLYGQVTPGSVTIHRVVAMYRNSFKPYFFGRFVATPAGVRLEGVFTEHWLAKIFLLFWVTSTSIVPFNLLTLAPQLVGPSLLLFLMPVFGLVVNFVGRRMASGDVGTIAAALDAALGA